jgi:beta-glucosidase
MPMPDFQITITTYSEEKNMAKVLSLILGVLLVWAGLVFARKPKIPLYKNSHAPVEARVRDLLSKMTLEEKIDLLGGNDFSTKKNVRLCIPQFVMTDGPLGPHGRGHATNYSAMINLAATFDVPLMYKVAENIGEEVRILGYNMLLGPCINIARVPLGGRTFEGFGEDPYLVSRMAVAYVKGVQSKRVITCTKHYLLNNQEWNRMSCDAWVDERALHVIYLPAFRAAVDIFSGKTRPVDGKITLSPCQYLWLKPQPRPAA